MLFPNLPNYLSLNLNKQHIILTGPLQSGKTSGLLKWADKKPDVYGILTPVLPTSKGPKRFFRDMQTKQQFAMETTPEQAAYYNDAILSVGRFMFSKKAFERAAVVVKKAIEYAPNGYLLIDEIGPLELRGEGLALVADLVAGYPAKHCLRVIWVVREGLVERVTQRFLTQWPSEAIAVITMLE